MTRNFRITERWLDKIACCMPVRDYLRKHKLTTISMATLQRLSKLRSSVALVSLLYGVENNCLLHRSEYWNRRGAVASCITDQPLEYVRFLLAYTQETNWQCWYPAFRPRKVARKV